jgi:hypothetical protein
MEKITYLTAMISGKIGHVLYCMTPATAIFDDEEAFLAYLEDQKISTGSKKDDSSLTAPGQLLDNA